MIEKVDFQTVVRRYLNGGGYFVAIENLIEDSPIYSNIQKLKIRKGWIYRIEQVKEDIYEIIDCQNENQCLRILGEKMGKYIFGEYLRLVTDMHEEIYASMEQSFTNSQLSKLEEQISSSFTCVFNFVYLSNEEVIVKLRYRDLPLFSDCSEEYVKNMVTPIFRHSEDVEGYKNEGSEETDVRTRAVFDFNEELAALAIYHETNVK